MALPRLPSSAESFSNLYDPASNTTVAAAPGGRLTFNPASDVTHHYKEPPALGAYEVSKLRRVCQVFAAFFYSLAASGIVFGFAALKPVLISEGVYSHQCSQKEIPGNGEACFGQEVRLDLMFAVGAAATNLAALPVGTILDLRGPKITSLIGATLLVIGSLLLAFASHLEQYMDGYLFGFFFIAVGGPFVFLSSFQLSNTFPRYSGLILAFLTGAFDSSPLIFLAYRLAYNASHQRLSLERFFLLYLVVPAFIIGVQLFLMPKQNYKSSGELLRDVQEQLSAPNQLLSGSIDTGAATAAASESQRVHAENITSELDSLLGEDGLKEHSKAEERKQAISGVWGALHFYSAWDQIRSPWFILIALFTMLQMLRMNYFLATIRQQYEELLPFHRLAIDVNTFFDFALPLGGIIVAPFSGLVLDNISTKVVVLLLLIFSTAVEALGLLRYVWAAYAKITLFVLFRPFYYTAISDYAAKVFGFSTFGKVYGLIICLSGIFSFCQIGLIALTHNMFHQDPRPVNLILMVAGLLVGIALVAYVWHKSRTIARQLLEEEAERAEESLMPGGDPHALEDHHPIDVHGYDDDN